MNGFFFRSLIVSTLISLSTITAQIPFQKELQALTLLSPAQKTELSTAWTTLHQMYQKQNSTTPATTLTPLQEKSIAPLFSTNYFELLQRYLSPTKFPKLPNDPEGLIHTNYATQHLTSAIARLASIFSVDYDHGKPTIINHGDARDHGIIVNLQNNTNAEFSLYQTSLSGTTKVQIGYIKQGLNTVNLHTAALQKAAVATKNNATIPLDSVNSFDLYEVGAQSPTHISIQMMSGAQLVTFLQTLPRKNKDIVEMNGLPTSPEYLAEPQDWYIVLIQNPTPKTAQKRDHNQRIQAINVSTYSNSYLLNMQINDEMITQDISAYANKPSVTDVYQPSSTFLEWQVDVARKKQLKQYQKESKQPQQIHVYQPSFTSLQCLTNQKINMDALPMIILPQFLYDLPEIQACWMLMITAYLAASTNFQFFKKAPLGDAFEYFQQLGCFGINNKYALFIDLYNRFQPGYSLYNASWLMSHAMYETDLQNCSDITQLYTAQDSSGHFVVNEHKYYFINFLTVFTPKISKIDNQKIFATDGFNQTYAYPLNQLYFVVTNALRDDIKEGIFATLHQPKAGTYQLTWKNKSNKILSSQYVYLDNPLSNMQISFINQVENWVGSSVPTDLIQLQPNGTTHFKVTYEFSSTNNKHILLAQPSSALDKQQVFLPLQFTEFPIPELYVDVFRELNTAPYTHCSIIKDGILPAPLKKLTIDDWRNGIYIVPGIDNNGHLTADHPGALTLLFYKSDKTFLGEITVPGLISNSSDQGIPFPVSIYNVHLTKYNCQVYLYLSTGIFLQYNDIS